MTSRQAIEAEIKQLQEQQEQKRKELLALDIQAEIEELEKRKAEKVKALASLKTQAEPPKCPSGACSQCWDKKSKINYCLYNRSLLCRDCYTAKWTASNP